ncbi:MAG: hypothetical protein HY748_16620 [Elusimicrobia bacterium]|nr:hypothetical protein [Elusimicrobiota bacterium]
MPPSFAQSGFQSGIAVRQNAVHLGAPRLQGPGLPEKGYWVSSTQVRPTLSYAADRWSVDAALEARLSWDSGRLPAAGASQSAGGPFVRGRTLEALDMTLDPVRRGDTEGRLRFERLKVAASLGFLDVEAGRQPVSLGTSRFLGVLDVLAPFPPGDLDATYKPGIDALRLRAAAGPEGEAELIAAASDPWEDSALILRLRSKVGSVDGELLTGKFRRRLFCGAGWEGDAGPLAIWGEVALFERRPAGEPVRTGAREAAFAGVAGADWRVRENATLGLALYRNDFGARRRWDLVSIGDDAPLREGWVFLAAREYAAVTFHAEPHALVHLDASGLMNPVDGSSLWRPRVTVNLHDNADMSLYAWFAAGRRPLGPTPRSEFGSMPDGLGLYGRVFF